MSFSWACLILDLHSSSSITSPTYSLTKWPWGEKAFCSRPQRSPGEAHWPSMLSTYLPDGMDAAKAPAPRKRPEDLHLAVLALGEGLVEAALPRWTNLQVWRVATGLRCWVKQWRGCDGGTGVPAGGIRTAACGWCTRTPSHTGSRLWPCSCSAGSPTGRLWRSEPFLSAGSPANVERAAGKVNLSGIKPA